MGAVRILLFRIEVQACAQILAVMLTTVEHQLDFCHQVAASLGPKSLSWGLIKLKFYVFCVLQISVMNSDKTIYLVQIFIFVYGHAVVIFFLKQVHSFQRDFKLKMIFLILKGLYSIDF